MMEEAVPVTPEVTLEQISKTVLSEWKRKWTLQPGVSITSPDGKTVIPVPSKELSAKRRYEIMDKAMEEYAPSDQVLLRMMGRAIPKPPAVKTEEWKLREAIADTAYGLAHGVKEEDIRKRLTRNPRAKYWFEPEDVDYILREAKREVAEPKLESVIEYDRQYSLEELREMARQGGLSPSGSKKEIAARLIARGIK